MDEAAVDLFDGLRRSAVRCLRRVSLHSLMEIVRLHLARIGALNDIPVHGFVIKHPRAGAILVDTGIGSSAELIKEWRIVKIGRGAGRESRGVAGAGVRATSSR